MEWDTVWLYVKIAAGVAAAMWGGMPELVQVLIILMLLDIATGVLAAFVNREISSNVSARGIAKKSIVLILVAAGVLLEPVVNLAIGKAIAGFYAMHEGLSIIENAARAGLPVPQVMRDALRKLSPEAETEGRRKLEDWRG